MSKKKREYRVCGAYDTETCNLSIRNGGSHVAYPVLYTIIDIRLNSIKSYNPLDGDVRYYRRPEDVMSYLADLIDYGKKTKIVPVIVGYNILFDVTPLIGYLEDKWELETIAQSSSSPYTIDLYDGKDQVLRIWDLWHLEQGGLERMGRSCDLPKLRGSWNYDLVRTPYTALTSDELKYARRDCDILLMYLRHLLESHDYLTEKDFGDRLVTSTSIVRLMAERVIGKMTYRGHDRDIPLSIAYRKLCRQEEAKSYDSYALRKACFRGGLAFTSGRWASTVQEHVASLDVTSMHHAWIVGRAIPTKFEVADRRVLDHVIRSSMSLTIEDVLSHYDRPFDEAYHARIKIKGLRLKSNTVFYENEIGIISADKMHLNLDVTEAYTSEAGLVAEQAAKESGWMDSMINGVCAYGKVISADEIILHVTELEAWCIAQVYEWSDLIVECGEISMHWITPPDYVTLQTNILYRKKSDVKRMIAKYHQGNGIKCPDTIDPEIRSMIENGTISETALRGYYQADVKSAYNGIYGSQAMDAHKPAWKIDDGKISVNSKTVIDRSTYKPVKNPKSIYTYGMRIAGSSRMHLIIALELLDGLVRPLSGDTDSIKCVARCSNGVIMKALRPLHDATDKAINKMQSRVRKAYPDIVSDLKDLGHFDVEECAPGEDRWEYEYDGWNKARITMSHGKYHVTCAGLPQPEGMYTIVDWCEDMDKQGHDFGWICGVVMGYNADIDASVAHMINKIAPDESRYRGTVTDYLGDKRHIDVPTTMYLEESGITLADDIYTNNEENIDYLDSVGRPVDRVEKYATVVDGTAKAYKMIGGDILNYD